MTMNINLIESEAKQDKNHQTDHNILISIPILIDCSSEGAFREGRQGHRGARDLCEHARPVQRLRLPLRKM